MIAAGQWALAGAARGAGPGRWAGPGGSRPAAGCGESRDRRPAAPHAESVLARRILYGMLRHVRTQRTSCDCSQYCRRLVNYLNRSGIYITARLTCCRVESQAIKYFPVLLPDYQRREHSSRRPPYLGISKVVRRGNCTKCRAVDVERCPGDELAVTRVPPGSVFDLRGIT
ncbi:uncharacterized protein LOC126336062 [Schistocerca gregaria]|uniref:uncharacterized protein LOC126336062 n=1 Tax=Schistocerca gregaria TaxID=7010 RepID=UPI00211EB66D|nr:uncharacterized protein LOC126336062 [Schistocerca gregaria]